MPCVVLVSLPDGCCKLVPCLVDGGYIVSRMLCRVQSWSHYRMGAANLYPVWWMGIHSLSNVMPCAVLVSLPDGCCKLVPYLVDEGNIVSRMLCRVWSWSHYRWVLQTCTLFGGWGIHSLLNVMPAVVLVSLPVGCCKLVPYLVDEGNIVSRMLCRVWSWSHYRWVLQTCTLFGGWGIHSLLNVMPAVVLVS